MTNGSRDSKFSRRTFLMGALASASLPAMFSTMQARAASGPNDTILVGFIGVGRQGRTNMKEAINRGMDANARVVAVCDLDSKRLHEGKELVEKIYAESKDKVPNYQGCEMYADYRELLARSDLDAVIIVTPDHWHALPAVHAARAGKDIYLEKPLTYSIKEGQALVRAVRENKRILQVGSQHRSNKYFRNACELVRNGRIGNLKTIKVTVSIDKGIGDAGPMPVPENLDYNTWLGPTPEAPYSEDRVHPQNGYKRPGWLQIEQYCRGMVTGWGAHMNDLAQWGNGTDETGLVDIEAKGEFSDRGLFDVHTNYTAQGTFTNGVKLIQETGKGDVRFEGEDGWILATRNKLEASNPELLEGKIPDDGVHLYHSKNHMMNFYDCIRSRKDPVASVEVGHRSNTICVITHISMKLGRKLNWDPKAERFRDDDEANALLDYEHRGPWTLS